MLNYIIILNMKKKIHIKMFLREIKYNTFQLVSENTKTI